MRTTMQGLTAITCATCATVLASQIGTEAMFIAQVGLLAGLLLCIKKIGRP